MTVVNDFAGVEVPLSQVPLRGTSAGICNDVQVLRTT